MRITRIDLEGKEGHFAIARRKRGSDKITVEILAPNCHEVHTAKADIQEQIFCVAEFIQRRLDDKPDHRKAVEYFRHLVQMSDL